MRTQLGLLHAIWLVALSSLPAVSASDPESATSPAPASAAGAIGRIVSLTVQTGHPDEGTVHLAGRDAGQQLLVTGVDEQGQVHDVTRLVRFEAAPSDVVAIDETGYLVPRAEGNAVLRIGLPDVSAVEVRVSVTNIQEDLPVHFADQIVPIFTKYSCNGGGCHGKSSGQNGFRLSLLGFEPGEDFEHLVREGRGRRLFPAAPDRSLLLLKATARVPHGGGERITPDSPAYRLLRRWIEQGMPAGRPDAPVLSRVALFPKERRLGRAQSQQLVVIGHYSDGSIRDVTRMTQFDSNDREMADVSPTGLVTTGQLAGSAAIMARYQGRVDVFRATVPLGQPLDDSFRPQNFIDEFVLQKLKDLGLPPSPLADGATFLRRVTVDIAGRLPSLAEAAALADATDAASRAQIVDRLLDSPDYADYFASKWNAILRNRRRSEADRTATYAFHGWIRASLVENKPYDQWVRELLTASGEMRDNPPVAWYREVRDPSSQVEDTAQLFLGLRVQCARCHHHPFERWSQEDYYGFQAFFSRVARKRGLPNEERVYHNPGLAEAQNPKTQRNVRPAGLGSSTLAIDAQEDPRFALAEWISAPDNPFFARALVNRYWKHFFGRGLVEPEDDMRVTNPPTHPELLDALSQDFVRHGHDLKHLIRTICNSRTYQLSAEPNPYNRDDKQNFSRYYPKRLQAEVLLDAIDQVTGTSTDFGLVPVGTRAVQLPDTGFESYFLTVFGRPESASACECERTSDANLAQCLHLLNSAEVLGKLSAQPGRAATLAADAARDPAMKIRELYLLAFAREPLADELGIARQHVEKAADPRPAYEDLVWALLNTKEFLFNH